MVDLLLWILDSQSEILLKKLVIYSLANCQIVENMSLKLT